LVYYAAICIIFGANLSTTARPRTPYHDPS
jgi:hypothetical protein